MLEDGSNPGAGVGVLLLLGEALLALAVLGFAAAVCAKGADKGDLQRQISRRATTVDMATNPLYAPNSAASRIPSRASAAYGFYNYAIFNSLPQCCRGRRVQVEGARGGAQQVRAGERCVRCRGHSRCRMCRGSKAKSHHENGRTG